MKTYTVEWKAFVSLTVEAESEGEALNKAESVREAIVGQQVISIELDDCPPDVYEELPLGGS